ncbi:MAG: hypothetical protein RR405_04300, partial [Clostridia bacterium]
IGETGANWEASDSLNGVLGSIMVNGVSLVDTIAALLKSDAVKGILPSLGINPDTIIQDGKIDLTALFTNQTFGSFFKANCTTYRDDASRKTFRTSLNASGILGILKGIVIVTGDPATGTKELKIGDIVSAETGLAIAYDLVNGEVTNAAIEADLNSPFFASKDSSGRPLYPFVRIGINQIDVEKATVTTAEQAKALLGVNEASYSDNFNIGLNFKLNLKGMAITPDPVNAPTTNYALDGEYSISLNANLDLLNESNEANRSHAYLAIKVNGKELAAAEYVGASSELRLTFDNTLKHSSGVPYMKLLVEMLGAGAVDMLPSTSYDLAKTLLRMMFNDASETQTTQTAQIVLGEDATTVPAKAGTTWYYTPTYTNVDGVVIGGMDIVQGFQGLLKMLSKPVVTPPANGVSEASAAATTEVWNNKLDISAVIKYVVSALGSKDGNLTLDVDVKQLITKCMPNLGGDIANSFLAKIMVDNNLISVFKTAKLITASNNTTDLTEADAILIYKYLSGQLDITTAPITEDQKTAVGTMINKYVPTLLAGMLKGSSMNGVGTQGILTELVDKGQVKLTLGADGISIKLTEKGNNNFAIGLDLGFSLKAGDAAASTIGKITVPEKLNDGKTVTTDGKVWYKGTLKGIKL